jgi:hypothetical protein
MKLGYDIFRQLENGSPLWIAQVDSLDEAKNKLDSLIRSSPGQYFVRDAENGKVIQRMGFSGSSGSEDEQSQS